MFLGGPSSLVGIATGYGLDGPGIDVILKRAKTVATHLSVLTTIH
jgi:hypothetical protein